MESFRNFSEMPSTDRDSYSAEQLISDEEKRLRERFTGVAGKAKALLGAFLLSSNVAHAVSNLPESATTDLVGQDYSQRYENQGSASENVMMHEDLYEDVNSVWSVEYLKVGDGRDSFFLKRFVKTKRDTHERVVLGEFDNVFTATKTLSGIPEVPDKVMDHVRYYSDLIQRQRDINEDLSNRGLLQLPDGRHGLIIPGTEKVVDGRRIHQEIRRSYDADFDVITLWEVDGNGEVVDSSSFHKGSTEYDRYFELIEGLNNPPMP